MDVLENMLLTQKTLFAYYHEKGRYTMKSIKRIVTLILALVAVFAISATAFAYTETAVSGTRYVTSSDGTR